MTIDKAKFRKPVVPGDRVEFHMRKLNQTPQHVVVRGEAKVDGALVCEAEIGAIAGSGKGRALNGAARDVKQQAPAAFVHPLALVESGAELGMRM